MARYMRGYGQYHLGKPIVGPGIAWHGPGTYLATPYSPNAQNRRAVHSKLRPPAVVASFQVFFGPKINLNVMTPERLRQTVTRRRPSYSLGPPAIVGAGIAWHGPGTVYAKEPLRSIRRRKTEYFLRPPVVSTGQVFTGPKVWQVTKRNVIDYGTRRAPIAFIEEPVIPPLAEPVRITLAPSRRQRGRADLISPAVVGAGIAWHGPGTVYAKEPLRSIRRRKTEYFLRPPVPVTAALFYGPSVHLAKRFPPRVKSHLGAPTDTIGLEDQGQVATWLAYSRRGRPVYVLFKPTDTIGLEDQGQVSIALAPQRRGAPKSGLRPPQVVFGAVELSGPTVWRTYSRRGAPKSHLEPPTDTIGLEDQGQVSTTLAYSRRGRPLSTLRPPAILASNLPTSVTLAPSRRPLTKSVLRPPAVTTAAGVFFGPQTWLAYSQRGRPLPGLGRTPAVEVTALGGVMVSLAPQRRGQPKSVLRPAAVTAARIFYGPTVHLTRGRRPQTKSILRLPQVVFTAVELLGPKVALAYSRRGKPVYRLQPPTILQTNGEIRVTLAPQRRGISKSRLRQPVVVFLAVEIYGPVVVLTRIKPPPTIARLSPPADITEAEEFPVVRVHLTYSRRPVAKSLLRPPAVVAPVVSYGPLQWLTYSRRGTPKLLLKPPAVVSSPPAYQQVLPPALAYSRRGRPIYKLRPPTRVFPVLFFGPQVTLRPQVRGIPKPFLRPPQVVRLAIEIYGPKVWLTYSRRPKTRSELLPPTVVEAFIAQPRVTLLARITHPPVQHVLRPAVVVRTAVEIYGPKTWLTYSRRPKPQYRLSPPAVVARAPFRGIKTWLTYSRRGRPIYFRQLEVIGKAPFRGILTHLTRIKPPPVVSTLNPPAVVGGGIAFYGPLTVLVRIRPPKVIHFLRVTLVAFRRPHGDVCGFDIAGTFVCSLETPGSQVSGSSSTRFGISGSSRAGSTVSGSESEGGSVSGSDRKAT